MKQLTFVFLILLLNLTGRAQNHKKAIIGTWIWSNENLVGDVMFDKTTYFIDISYKSQGGHYSKAWLNYTIKKDTIYFYETKGPSAGNLHSKYYIQKLLDSYMELTDPKGETDHYYKVSNLIPFVPKEKSED